MAYTLADDDRVHLTPDDAKTLARKIIDFARKEAVGDLTGPVCGECLSRVLIVAITLLAENVGASGKTGEMSGVALTLIRSQRILGDVSNLLIQDAVRIDPRGMLDIILGDLSALNHP